jgi:hypothetical protein
MINMALKWHHKNISNKVTILKEFWWSFDMAFSSFDYDCTHKVQPIRKNHNHLFYFILRKVRNFKWYSFDKCFLNYSFIVPFGHMMNVDLLHNLVGKEKKP